MSRHRYDSAAKPDRWPRLAADPWLTAWCGFLAAMALTAAVFMIYGAGQGSTKTIANGGDWFFFAFFLAAPTRMGWWLAKRQRKIRVERQLEDVQESVDRVEELLTPAEPARLAVVRDLRPWSR
jgi:hypothetical protein